MARREVKEETLEAVYSISAKLGLENITTKRIAEEIKASEAMIYYHYKNKQDIYKQAFLNIHKEIDAIFKNYFMSKGLVLDDDKANICLETWLLYYGYWRDNPNKRAFYDSYIHSHYITKEIWTTDNASYIFFSSVFGRLMGNLERNTSEGVFAFIWSIIIESAISMAKVHDVSNKEIAENAKKIIGKILEAILSYTN